MTIREIAAMAGVSVSTVSKIINKKDANLSAETRERVLKLVRQYHYSPYSGVRAAVQPGAMLLGVAVNGNRPHGRLLDSLAKYASGLGYSCVVAVSHTPEEELRNLSVLRAQHVDGILWDRLEQSLPACSEALEGIPLRKMSCCEPPSLENSCIDYARLAYLGAEHLIGRGHKKLLCVTPRAAGYPEQAFEQGFRQCLFDHRIPFSGDRVCACGEEGLPEGKLFENTAALCFDTEAAAGVYEACARKNRRIPKYLSVLSLSCGETGPFFPPLSVIPLPYDALARHVCDRLTADLENRRMPETVFVTEAAVSGDTSVESPLPLRNKKIVVVGPVNMDTVISLQKFPQMGETTLTESRLIVPGGKGLNQAVGVAKLEAEAYLIGKVGKDYEGGNLYDYLQTNGVNTGGVAHTSRAATGHAYVYVQRDGESGIVVYKGANGLLTAQDILQNAAAFDNASFCLLQTEVGLDAVEAAAGLAWEQGVRLLLKPSAVYELSDELLRKIDIFLPNEREISYFCPAELSCEEKARYFLDRGVKNVILTMGNRGCYWNDGVHSVYFPAEPFEAVDTTGAADAFAAALAVMLSQNSGMETAIRCAAFAAGYSTTKQGVPNSLIDRSTLEFYMEREYCKKEAVAAHSGQNDKNAHSAKKG